MILPYIEILFACAVALLLIASILVFCIGMTLGVRNFAGRISVIRAIHLQPGLIGAVVAGKTKQEWEAKAQRLLDQRAKKAAKIDSKDVLAATIELLNEEAFKFTIRTSRSDQILIARETNGFSQQTIKLAITVLRSMIEDHHHFTAVVNEVIDAVRQINGSDIKSIEGRVPRRVSVGSLLQACGGGSKNVLSYFVSFLLRDAVMELASFHLSLGVGNREVR